MNKNALLFILLLMLVVLSVPAFAQSGGDFDLTWWTVDGGGGHLSGGDYSLDGTLGQADAGVLRGGAFTLQGGFWGASGLVHSSHHIYLPLVIR